MLSKILSLVIYLIVRAMHSTYRYRFLQNEHILNLRKENKNFIFAIWHQTLLPGILAQTGYPYIVIISKSKDADPVAFTCTRLGHYCVRGSSKKGDKDKGGKAAKNGMIEYLNQGHPGAITVDGPKGPAFEVKPGIIDMAKSSQALIIPYTLAIESYWEFNSWDKFRLPKPFSKILIIYGNPIDVSSDQISFEEYQSIIEKSLLNEKQKADQQFYNWKLASSKNWFQIGK
jgi:lysophospholipid acyltransferase (LPLAT)-like uncharacterized protein